MSLGSYISTLETVLDLDAQADLAEERRQVDLAWQREQALWIAANALPVICDDSLDVDYRLGFAMSALESIARWAPALAGKIAG